MITLRLGISENYLNKNRVINDRNAHTEFISTEFTSDQLADWISSGKTIAVGDYENNYRHKNNFISSQLIGIDIDDGEIRSVTQLMQIPFINQYAFFVGPTASSKPDNPRTRVFFILGQKINDPVRYQAAVISIINKLTEAGVTPDQACKDPARMFHGSTVPGYLKQDVCLPISVIDEMVSRLETEKKSKQRRKQEKDHSHQSKATVDLPADEMVNRIRIALTYIHPQLGYDQWLRICMAVYDRFPNEIGVALIEQWSPGYTGEVAAKFQSFGGKREDGVTINTLYYYARQNGFDLDHPIPVDQLVQQRFIAEASLRTAKTMLIRSDTGTGKTEWIKKLVVDYRFRAGKDPRILVISHRVQLIQGLCNRLNFENYAGLYPEQLRVIDRLIITPNSLYKLVDKDHPITDYDIVIIDEVEQVLDHLAGETFKGNEGLNALVYFTHLLKKAEMVIGLDAHAGYRSWELLSSIRSDMSYVVNTFVRDCGPMQLYKKKGAWLDQIRGYLELGNRIAIPCESKTRAKTLDKILREAGYRVFTVHSDNSDSREAREFIDNINDEIKKYDAFIYSPTLGTGVDIQTEVDAVFGCFNGRSITPEESIQMLARCRNTKETHVYFSNSKHSEDTDPDTIYNHYYDRNAHNMAICGIDVNGKPEISKQQHDYLRLQAEQIAKRNRSMNSGFFRFPELAKRNYNLEENAEEGSDASEELDKRVSEELKQEEKHKTLTYDPVTPEEYNLACERRNKTEKLEYGHRRWQIEDIYGQSITEEIYTHHMHNGAKKLIQFVDIHRSRQEMIQQDHEQENKDVAWKNRKVYTSRWDIFLPLITVFGAQFTSAEIPEQEFHTRLGNFKQQTDPYEKLIRNLLDFRGEWEAERVLRCLLRHLGLKFERKRHGKKHDKSVSYYLNEESLTLMRDYARARIKAKGYDIQIDTAYLGRL